MFVKASWIAIIAALCVAQTHAAQAAMPANAASGTSTLLHDANGKAIGSAANYYDKNGNFISSETTFFNSTSAPAAAPAVTPPAPAPAPVATSGPVKVAGTAAEPAYHSAISTLIHDANGKAIGSQATYFDKDGKSIGGKTTYFNSTAPAPAPAPAPVATSEPVKVAGAAAEPAYHSAISTLIHDANGKAIGSQATYFDKDGKSIGGKTTYFNSTAPAPAPAPAPVATSEPVKVAGAAAEPAYHSAISTLIHDANGKAIGSQATYFDKDGKSIGGKTTYFNSTAPAAAPAVVGTVKAAE